MKQRRDFLKAAAGGLFAAGALGGFSGIFSLANASPIKGGNMSELSPRITLRDGAKMPILGLGTWDISDSAAPKVIENALLNGYRLIDTAQMYRNESGIGKGIKAAIAKGIKREEIFVETKIHPNNGGEKTALKSIDDSLTRLGLDYVDLFIIHWPHADDRGSWAALEAAQKAGKVRSIGLSNYRPDTLSAIIKDTNGKPVIDQIELNPYYARFEEVAQIEKLGLKVQSWSSFGSGKGGILQNEILNQIGKKHGKSAAQVVLRWLVQRGIFMIPKTTKLERLRENINVFDFELNASEMAQIESLDRKKSLAGWG